MPDVETRETIRCLRLGDVRKLVRHRCGVYLPDDDAGFEYLVEMLKIISLGPDPQRRMLNAVEIYAPFMSRTDAEQIVTNVSRMPIWERWPKPKLLGERLRLTNAERERLSLWRMTPCDVSEEELAEQHKAKDRARKRRKRAEAGGMSREAYLDQFARSINKTKPWLAWGIKKSAYYKRKAKERTLEWAAA